MRVTAAAASLLALTPSIGLTAQTAGNVSGTMLTSTERISLQLDKTEAERYLNGQSATPPTRRVSVLIFNPSTNHAAKTLVVLGTPHIQSVEQVDPAEVPLTKEDVVDALAPAKQNTDVRGAVGETLDRCLDLIFRDEHGYLLARAHVDISKHSVTVEGGR